MYLRIQPTSEIPIYTQLIYQIKKGIIKKELMPGESLPSVRSLASDIGINLHTVNKAYKLLVDEGVLVQQKKGFMVNSSVNLMMKEDQFKAFREKLEELIIDARIFNVSDEVLMDLKTEIMKTLKESDEDDVV